MQYIRECRSLMLCWHLSEPASQCNVLQERAPGSSFSDKVLMTFRVAKCALKLIFKRHSIIAYISSTQKKITPYKFARLLDFNFGVILLMCFIFFQDSD